MNTHDLFNRTISEEAARDEALDHLRRTRSWAIAAARRTARNIAKIKGDVTSTHVLRVMKKFHPELLEGIDHRFMGVIFRDPEWIADGWENTGSHGRPVRRWRLRR